MTKIKKDKNLKPNKKTTKMCHSRDTTQKPQLVNFYSNAEQLSVRNFCLIFSADFMPNSARLTFTGINLTLCHAKHLSDTFIKPS